MKKWVDVVELVFGDYFAFFDYDVAVLLYPHYFVSSLQLEAFHDFFWDCDLSVGCDFAYLDYLV
jgi:hypothetical protein